MAQYLLLGLCFLVAMLALWKGDALVGLGVLGGCLLVYWITMDRLSLDWLR
jgi:hypothetical protein